MPRSSNPYLNSGPSPLGGPPLRVRDERSLARQSNDPPLHENRVQPLLSILDQAKTLISQVGRADTPYAALALELLEKAIREVDVVVRLVERTGAADKPPKSQEPPSRIVEDVASIRVPVFDEMITKPRRVDEQVASARRGVDRPDLQDVSPREQDIRRAASPARGGGPRRTRAGDDFAREDEREDKHEDERKDERRFERVQRPPSSQSRRKPSPPPASARDRLFSSRPSSVKPPSSSPPYLARGEYGLVDRPGGGFASSDSSEVKPRRVDTPTRPDDDELDVKPRTTSRAASRVFSPPLPSAPPADDEEPAPSSRRFGDRRRSQAPPPESPRSPPAPAEDEDFVRPKSRGDGFSRPKSRSSTASSRHPPAVAAAPRRPSSRSRFVADSSDEEDVYPASHNNGAGDQTGRRRARSIGGPAARSHSGRSDDTRRALELASAPPMDEPSVAERRPPVLRGAKVARALAEAATQLDPKDGTAALLALSLVSKKYHEAATPVLYRAVTVASKGQLDALNRTLDVNPSLGKLVHSLTIRPLDTHLPTPSPESLIAPVKALLDRLPSLTSLDEDFTAGEWDIRELASGRDYPLTVSSPAKLVRFRSGKNWWEIGALFSLLQAQPALIELVLGGAAKDRDWAGGKLLAALGSGEPPARRLESLEIAQVMHEDTLAVLLRATGGEHGGRLRSVRVGWQSIGSTDDDTPRASIPSALALVGSTLTHLALSAPVKASDDTAGLLDEIIAVLPRLEVLEWSEATDLAPLPLATSRLVTLLPPSLRVLRARALVSLSTSSILALLYKPEALPDLRVVDVRWANGTSAEEGREPWFKERHIPRIEDAAAELGIECTVGKGDEPLVFSRA